VAGNIPVSLPFQKMNSRFLFIWLVLACIDLYSFQWFRFLVHSFSNPTKWLAYLVFWSGTVVSIVITYFYMTGNSHTVPNSIMTYLRAWAFISYFAKFISIPFALLDDLRRLAGSVVHWFKPDYQYNASRSSFLSKLAAIAGGFPFVTLVYGMARNAYRYKTHKIQVPVKDLSPALAGLRIVQISDIHSGSFTSHEQVKKSIQIIQSLQPDLLFFTGDLVNYKADEVEPYIETFRQMKGKYGSYSIFGNHDYGDYVQWDSTEEKNQNLELLKKHHADIGWKLLLNAHETIDVKGHPISIIGVENFSASHRFSKYGNLAKAYEGSPADSLKFLLSHDPSHWSHEVTSRYQDIVLTCSGHTHGFQFGIEIPGFLRWSPSQYVYKEWAGLYTMAQQHLYVNRGFGFLGYPGRVGILPEITLIELQKAV
jgi:uncharacterized protein